MKKVIITCVLICFLFAGCASIREAWVALTGEEEEYTAEELAWTAMDYYESGNYQLAIEKFEKLKDWFPFSRYAILAELKIGDAHYKLEQYEEAIFAYEEFEKLHPRNEAIPYVIYQIGRCYFDRIDTIDRDQMPAREAAETFQRLIKQFPNDQYARLAKDHLNKCYKSLAGHEYIVGVFYFKSKHYEAAYSRFMSVISNYPDVGYHQKALDYITKCQEFLSQKES
ncbi:MAG: outer membrane protein assembly factor BamD [Deltaproteobacteria bacterium]|jgi:outer membrane protein assembly factor BamD|nr:outer membrane protein assembly factor BamD [Deltaproteobacteria bacterium]